MFCVNAVASGARVKKRFLQKRLQSSVSEEAPSEETSIERFRRGFLQKGLQSSASEEAPSEETSIERERESPVGAGLV